MKEPKAIEEIYSIRERLSTLPKDKIERRLTRIRKRYKRILVSS